MLKFKARPELKVMRETLCTQEEMSSLISVEVGRNVYRSLYSNIESGGTSADAKVALAISRALNVDVSEIFTKENGDEEVEEDEETDEESAD